MTNNLKGEEDGSSQQKHLVVQDAEAHGLQAIGVGGLRAKENEKYRVRCEESFIMKPQKSTFDSSGVKDPVGWKRVF